MPELLTEPVTAVNTKPLHHLTEKWKGPYLPDTILRSLRTPFYAHNHQLSTVQQEREGARSVLDPTLTSKRSVASHLPTEAFNSLSKVFWPFASTEKSIFDTSLNLDNDLSHQGSFSCVTCRSQPFKYSPGVMKAYYLMFFAWLAWSTCWQPNWGCCWGLFCA